MSCPFQISSPCIIFVHYMPHIFTKCHLMLIYVYSISNISTICHLWLIYIHCMYARCHLWIISVPRMSSIFIIYHLCSPCHISFRYVSHMSHVFTICSLYGISLQNVISPYVTYAHMWPMFTIYYLWLGYAYDFYIGWFCITYVKIISISSVWDVITMSPMFILWNLCSPYIVVSGWHMFTICHPCPSYVNCGWDMFTICHLYLPYITICHLCSLYVS